MKRLLIAAVAIPAALTGTASIADTAVTVQSLLAQGFEARGAITSEIGPGIFLQKGDRLFLCFASETPTSPDVKTNYCKPVY